MFQVLAFIKYWLQQVDDHSLHSPFVFDLYQQVIANASKGINPKIEALRKELYQNQFEFELKEFGAGSRVNGTNRRKVSEVAKNSSTPPKFSSLLVALIDYFDYRTVVELGTSLGLNTLYISQNENCEVITFEGDPMLTDLSTENFYKFKKMNIEVVEGNIDETLAHQLEKMKSVDMAYIDANHRYVPTLDYYESIRAKCHEKSLIVLDDIHWSQEMNRAWNEIKKREEVIISIDLFEGGLLFFDPKLTKGDYVLKF